MATTLHFVKKARKTIRGSGIKKGESYYWWKFYRLSKQVSKTKPKPSQLIRSEFLSTVQAYAEEIVGIGDIDTAQSRIPEIIDELNTLADEQESKKENMPDSLQEAFVGELLQSRADNLRGFAEALGAVDLNVGSADGEEEGEESEEGDAEDGEIREALSTLHECSYEGE